MKGLLIDFRHAARAIRRSPGFSLISIAILALGIGANTAIFSLVDVILFRELPIHEPANVVRLFAEGNDPGGLSTSSYPSYLDYRDQVSSVEDLAAYSSGNAMNLTVDERAPERVSGAIVTGNFFEMLGVKASVGRMISPLDDVPGGGAVVVLSDRLWSEKFGRETSILGKTVRLNSETFTVVGVAPREFWGLDLDEPAQLWVPMSMTAAALPQYAAEMIGDRRFSWLDVVGRLREGVTIEQAEAEIRAIGVRRSASQQMADPLGTLRPANGVARGTSNATDAMTRISWILLAVVAVVLLIACADVAGLMLVRSERRQHEIALRLAMGSGKARIARQLLVESLLLSVVASVGSIFVALWCVRAFLLALPPDFSLPFQVATNVIDLRVLTLTAAIALVSTLIFGTVPAVRGMRSELLPSLRNETSRGSRRSRSAQGFVVLQVTLAAVLLVAAGLLVRTLIEVSAVNPGFEPAGKVVATIDLARAGYADTERPAAWARILEEARRLPGAGAAALGKTVPVQSSGMRHSVRIGGYTPPPGTFPNVDLNIVTPGYFEALGVPILSGRDFTETDVEDGRAVVLINRAMADRYWPGRNPIGQWIGELEAEVIGIVANVRNRSLRDEPAPMAYRPLSQLGMSGMTLLVSSARPEGAMTRELTETVRALDPDLPLFDVWSLRRKLGFAMAQERLLTSLLGAFALLGLLLAAGGLYSLIAYRTELRRKEFGIRMALGAERRMILSSVLRESLALTLTGLVLGIAIAAALTRFAAALLFGVSPLDPITFAAAAVLLLAAGAVAGQIPARRAMNTDPATILRHE